MVKTEQRARSGPCWARSGVDIEYISEGGSVGARSKIFHKKSHFGHLQCSWLSTQEAEQLYLISMSVVYQQMGQL